MRSEIICKKKVKMLLRVVQVRIGCCCLAIAVVATLNYRHTRSCLLVWPVFVVTVHTLYCLYDRTCIVPRSVCPCYCRIIAVVFATAIAHCCRRYCYRCISLQVTINVLIVLIALQLDLLMMVGCLLDMFSSHT